jgi:hypothetical protein
VTVVLQLFVAGINTWNQLLQLGTARKWRFPIVSVNITVVKFRVSECGVYLGALPIDLAVGIEWIVMAWFDKGLWCWPTGQYPSHHLKVIRFSKEQVRSWKKVTSEDKSFHHVISWPRKHHSPALLNHAIPSNNLPPARSTPGSADNPHIHSTWRQQM